MSRPLEGCSSMTIYIAAHLQIHDRPVYERYASRFMQVLQQYGGRLLAADEAPVVIEGGYRSGKFVLLSFESDDAAERWSRSDEYRAIAIDRRASADCSVLKVLGC